MQAEESAVAIGWTLETFGTPFVNWLKDKAQKEKWKHFDWPKAEQAYLNKLSELYGRVRILGNSMDVPLGNIFTQVHILDKPTARQRYDINELRKQGGDRLNFQHSLGKRTHGMALVKSRQNLFILGKPGAGKTTFLKYITIQAARKNLPQIPIFVSLNQWADSKWGKGQAAALFPFIVEQFDICDFPEADRFIEYLLREGRALLLFDGLDEVKQEQEQRRRLTYLLQDFARKYSKSKHLITCRIAASDYAFEGFVDVEVADFMPEQVQEYARNWFGEQKKKFTAFVDELAKPDNQGLAELCNTPLLLSLLCLTFDNDMRFPTSRAELYGDALETLLRKWDSNRQIQRDEIYRELSHVRKRQLLMNIAVDTFEKGELFFRQRDLEERIVDYLAKLPDAPPADALDGTVLLKAMEAQHSILVERAHGIYSFSHLTFQEYLTARYAADNQGRGVTSKLIRSHLVDQRWREVFLLTSSLLGDADEFINTMRGAVDNVIVDNSALHDLLTWADRRIHHINITVEQQHSQVEHALLIRKLARDLDLDSDHAFTIERVLALALALDHTRTRIFTLDRARTLVRTLALTLTIAPHRVLALARATIPYGRVDYGLYYAWGYAMLFASEQADRTDKDWQAAMQQLRGLVGDIINLSGEAELVSLAQQLAAYPIPLSDANAQVWQQYADALFAIMRDQRILEHEWTFRDREIDKLNNYFYANELLVQCLKVAVVSDRSKVLNGLLLPPKAGEEDKITR